LDEASKDEANVVIEKRESNAVKKLFSIALKNQNVINEYDRIKKQLREGVPPIEIRKNTVAMGKSKVLVKKNIVVIL
jgi:hypothetical protein